MKLQFRRTDEINKIWGKELIIVNNESYCGKLLCFKRGSKLSNHFHLVKDETFYVLQGQLVMYYFNLIDASKLKKTLNVGDVVDIPKGTPHKLEALEDSIIVEFSTHHEDSDSYRIEPSAG